MKQMGFFLAFLLFGGMLAGQAAAPDFVIGHLYVKLKLTGVRELPQFHEGESLPDFAIAPELRGLMEAYQVTAFFKPFRTPAPHLQSIYELSFERAEATQAFIEAWERIPWIEYAERIPIPSLSYTPDDLNLLQWHLPKIKAEQAWDYSKGSSSVVVAIIDDAILLSHNDLAPRIWTNPGEIPGDSIDNDGNGFIDDVNGYDLADLDNDPNPPAAANNNTFSHGTHVSGIAAAATDNGTGIASIGFNVQIMPIKTKQDTSLSNSQLQATFTGLDYAIVTGADVVNMSFGGPTYSGTYEYLVQTAVDSGMVLVAAAGNTGSYSASYPANYLDCISVASTNSQDEKSGFSTYHANVDVSAPGSAIYSCTAGSNSSYGFKSGTSMASPLVAGLCALMRSVDSTMTPLDLRRCLNNTTDDISAQNPNYPGWLGTGRINAKQAMACMLPLALENHIAGGLDIHRVYPNPSAGLANLSASVPYSGFLRVELRGLQGRSLAVPFEGEVGAGEFSFNWQLPPSLGEGMYLLVWELGGETVVQKLVIR